MQLRNRACATFSSSVLKLLLALNDHVGKPELHWTTYLKTLTSFSERLGLTISSVLWDPSDNQIKYVYVIPLYTYKCTIIHQIPHKSNFQLGTSYRLSTQGKAATSCLKPNGQAKPPKINEPSSPCSPNKVGHRGRVGIAGLAHQHWARPSLGWFGWTSWCGVRAIQYVYSDCSIAIWYVQICSEGKHFHWKILGGSFLKYHNMTKRGRARVLCQVSQSVKVCVCQYVWMLCIFLYRCICKHIGMSLSKLGHLKMPLIVTI